MEAVQNRFVVEGNYKYKYNNGLIAMADTRAACTNFIKALERIPEIIRQHVERTDKMRADVPKLQAIVDKVWGKEGELKELKAQLVELDKRITSTLAAKQPNPEVVEDITPADTPAQSAQTTDTHPEQSDKSSLVAEPQPLYKPHVSTFRPAYRPTGL